MYAGHVFCVKEDPAHLHHNIRNVQLRSGHTERGLPQRTAVSVRCGMLHSKQTLLTIIF